MSLQPKITDQDIDNAKSNLANLKTVKPLNKKEHNEKLRDEMRDMLSNKNKAKSFYKRLDINLLIWTQEILTEVIDLKKIEAESQKHKSQNRQHVIDQIKSVLSDNNTTATELFADDDIIKLLTKKQRKKLNKPRSICYKFKWRIFDRDYHWSGFGYLPLALRAHLAKGHSIESCILPKDEWLSTSEKISVSIPEEYADVLKNLINDANKQGIAKRRKELTVEVENA